MDTANGDCILKTLLEAKYVTTIVSCLSITPLIQQGGKLGLELALAQSAFGNLFWLLIIYYFCINVSHYVIAYNFVFCKTVFLYLPEALKSSLTDSPFSRMSHIKRPFSPVKFFFLNNNDRQDQEHYFCDLYYVKSSPIYDGNPHWCFKQVYFSGHKIKGGFLPQGL